MQGPDDPDARHLEQIGRGRIGRRLEASEDPAVVAVRDRERHRQVRPPHAFHGRPQGPIEGPAGQEPVAIVNEMAQSRRPADRVNARGLRKVVPVPLAHPVEVASLAAVLWSVVALDDVPHDLDAGRRAPQP